MKSAKNSAIIGGSIHGKRNISYDLFQGQLFVLLFFGLQDFNSRAVKRLS